MNQRIEGSVLRLSGGVQGIRSFNFIIQHSSVTVQTPRYIQTSAYCDVRGVNTFMVCTALASERDAVYSLQSILRMDFCRGVNDALYLRGSHVVLLRRKAEEFVLAFCMLFHPRLGQRCVQWARELDPFLVKATVAEEVRHHFLCPEVSRDKMLFE